jgi:cytochrome c-type biogenesis protein
VDAPFGVALAAGMLAAVNPCGFALLPAYLSFLVLGDDSPGRRTAVGRALVLTSAMTLGFAVTFGVFGLVVAPAASSIQQHLPWFTIGLGLALLGLGIWLLAGRHIPGFNLRGGLPGGSGKPITRSVPSMFAFGVSYAIASLGCTVGPFLAIVVANFDAGSVVEGIGLFLAYALGMGLLVGAAALSVALARTALITRLRRLTPALSRVAGGLLVVVGGYVAYYGWYEIRIFGGGAADDPVISAFETVQTWISDFVDSLGITVIAIVFAVLVVVALAISRRRKVDAETDAD